MSHRPAAPGRGAGGGQDTEKGPRGHPGGAEMEQRPPSPSHHPQQPPPRTHLPAPSAVGTPPENPEAESAVSELIGLDPVLSDHLLRNLGSRGGGSQEMLEQKGERRG